jgi:hypothetical protein
LPRLYARTFVRELAQLDRALGVLAELDTGAAKEALVAAKDDLRARLPEVVPVRDSMEHAEDRYRRRGRGGRPLDVQPFDSGVILAASGGVLVLGMLKGRCYYTTVADGSYMEVEVSLATLNIAIEAVQRVLDALPWRVLGPKHWTPSA